MNKKALLRFSAWLGAISVLYLVTFQLLKPVYPILQNASFAYLSVTVLYIVIVLIFLASIATVTPAIFVQIVIAGTAVKLLLFGAYTFYMIYADTANARVNVLFFFVGYVLFTVLEITSLYRFIRSARQ